MSGEQTQEMRDRIITLARRKKDLVLKDKQELEKQRQARIELKRHEVEKSIRKNEKARKERERVNAITPINSVAELHEELIKIQSSTPKKTEMAELYFLRDQIARKTQKKVPLTIKGKRSTTELKEELTQLIEDGIGLQMKSYLKKRIQHRLQSEDGLDIDEWYEGLVISASDETITVIYDGYDDERLTWTKEQIIEDVKNNDFILL